MEIHYQFVASGGREVADTFRSVEQAARDAQRAVGDYERVASRKRSGGPGASKGGPYRSAPSDTDPSVAATERAQRRATNVAKHEQEKRWRDVERSARRYEQEANREAAAVERAEKRKAAARQREHDRLMRNPLGAVGGLVRSAGSAVMGLGSSAIGAGVDLIGGAVRESLATQSIANRVSINARGAGKEAIDPTTLRKEFETAAIANPGQSAMDIGKATQAYVDLTGDIDTARGSMQTFATVASATGAKVEDVATAAASIGKQFDVKDAKDMQKVLGSLAFQGKGGAMTLKDIAAQFQRLAAAGAAFGIGKGPEGVAKLGGILQIARSGTGNARSAATATENIMSGLVQKGSKIAGLKVYNKDGSKRNINEVLADAVSLAGGNNMAAKEQQLLKVFGKQGIRGVNPLMNAYKTAAEGKTGKEAQTAGHDAVLKMLNDMANTGAQWDEIVKDASQAQEDAGAQLTGAWEQLKAAAGDRLAPVIAELATKIAGNDAVWSLLTASITLASNSLEALAAKLQELGLISGGSSKEKAEKYAALEAKTKGEMKQYEGKTLTPQEQNKYGALNAKMLTAKEGKEREQGAASLEGYDLSQIRKADKWSGRGGGEELTKKAYDRLGGGSWLMNVPIVGHSDTLQGLAGENAAQRGVRHAGEQRQGEIFKGEVSKIDGGGEAASKLTAAAEQLSRAADKLSQTQRATVTGGTK